MIKLNDAVLEVVSGGWGSNKPSTVKYNTNNSTITLKNIGVKMFGGLGNAGFAITVAQSIG